MGLAKTERKNAVKTICRLIDETDLPVVLMGDFNAEPQDNVLHPLRERLQDTDVFSSEENNLTYPSDAPKIKIDYIFYRGLTCKKTTIVSEIFSDHLPIIAEFEP